MLELYVIRHGLAGKSQEEETIDNERALNKKGKRKDEGDRQRAKKNENIV